MDLHRPQISITIGRLNLLIGLIALLVAIALGIAVARYEIGVREFLIFLFGIIALAAVLMPSDTVLQVGLGAGIASIGLGWRVIHLTPDFDFSIFEVIIWALAATIMVRAVIRRERVELDFSIPLILFLIIALLTLLRGFVSDMPPDRVLGYGKQVLMLAPFFFVMQNLVRDLRTWKRLAYVAIIVSLYLSLIGLLIFFVPQLTGTLGILFTAETVEAVNFERASFPGWGPLAAWYFVLVFGLVVGLWNAAVGWRAQAVYLLALAVTGVAILTSGQRGAWVALLAGMGVYALFNWRRGVALVAISILLIRLVPEQSVTVRLASAFDPNLLDSSAVDRYGRANAALADIQNNPLLGLGFGVRTFVHSDYLEIGAAMGVAVLALFALALAATGKRLVSACFSQDMATRKLSHGVLAMFVTLVVALLSSGFVTLSYTVVVIWLFWGMSDQFARLSTSGNLNKEFTVA